VTTAAVTKTVVWLVAALAAAGCTIGRLHVDVIDMNDIETLTFDEAPTKPAAQADFKWDF
jgi:hypothetical protein